MKIAVIGLWHLGSVTAGCLAKAGHEVLGYDPELSVIVGLNQGQSPVFEPHLNELLQENIAAGKLKFSSQLSDIASAEIVWITYDTPVDENDKADVQLVINQINTIFPFLKNQAILLISSQLPVGTTHLLKKLYQEQFPEREIFFAYSPENLRLGKAIEIFTYPDRVVIGCEDEESKKKLNILFHAFTDNIVWMSVTSAEMTKHAINAFLATSVVFANEIASICELVGADATEVEQGLKTEKRIGPLAYLKPGPAFAGGTLARDVSYLVNLSEKNHFVTQLFPAVIASNLMHKKWVQRRLVDILGDIKHKNIAMLGLTYKAGTDTLRRSAVVETCEWLAACGANVHAYDPMLQQLPTELTHFIELKKDILSALTNADAVVISTDHAEFLQLSSDDIIKHMNQPFVFDAGGILKNALSVQNGLSYFTVGKAERVSV